MLSCVSAPLLYPCIFFHCGVAPADCRITLRVILFLFRIPIVLSPTLESFADLLNARLYVGGSLCGMCQEGMPSIESTGEFDSSQEYLRYFSFLLPL
ncbi:uncharacterized protein BJ212DRAFT_946700 [Suillus subaureus]|uniref:Uncharacterized protein n=1 Tax=Suillus subaureus TaxID=48587 RepID=A0A9P7DFT6_9AGAM|nr:uncharacterized protein BJ212DRAFT_946700 [Suillus subaureus]KAG1791134.1 hypothetical protein BJ212DRAFT_946700 [Suillus subaureus]